MASAHFAKAALSQFNAIRGDKPHSSITDWLEILSSPKYKEDDYEGIPELVESINLQAGGPAEASRAIRKKLKYGDVHRQLRALTILKALVENCGPKFQVTFANDSLIERIKLMASDSHTDEHVKRKLMSVLASWHRQFKDDPKMQTVAGLYSACGGGQKKPPPPRPTPTPTGPSRFEEQQRKAEEEAKRRAERKEAERKQREEAKAKAKAEKEAEKAKRSKPIVDQRVRRKPFNFEQEKPQVINSISIASQASNNLINALKLVNREQESIETNARVQECLAATKAARKSVVRYIQLVEDEEFIGTLIDSNERVINALELYDHLLKTPDHDSDDDVKPDEPPVAPMQRMTLTGSSESELEKLQDRQRAAVQRYKEQLAASGPVSPTSPSYVHPDLQDLNFGAIGASTSSTLPPPIRPNAQEEDRYQYHRGSLSDFSDYSSDDEAHHRAASSSAGHRAYETVVPATSHEGGGGLLVDVDDPFADPTDTVGTPGIAEKRYVF